MTLSRPRVRLVMLAAAATAALVLLAPLHDTLRAQTTTTSDSRTMTGHASADSAQSMLNFIITLNRDEIAAGKLAMERATRPDVRALAERVVEHHTKSLTAWTDIAPSVSLTVPASVVAAAPTTQKGRTTATAASTPVSEVRDTTTELRGGLGGAALHSAHLATMAELSRANGSAFDELYVKSEFDGHAAVLRELDLYPTTYTQLQTMFTEFRRMIDDHRIAARKLIPGM